MKAMWISAKIAAMLTLVISMKPVGALSVALLTAIYAKYILYFTETMISSLSLGLAGALATVWMLAFTKTLLALVKSKG